jgi:hypothetical protein
MVILLNRKIDPLINFKGIIIIIYMYKITWSNVVHLLIPVPVYFAKSSTWTLGAELKTMQDCSGIVQGRDDACKLTNNAR